MSTRARDDDNLDSVLFALASEPRRRVLDVLTDGSFTYDPAVNFAGVVSFSYQVCLPAPNGLVCDTAVQTIVVGPDAIDDAKTEARRVAQEGWTSGRSR